jgi:hypothetical protein
MYMDEVNNEIDDAVDDILTQLKTQNHSVTKEEKQEATLEVEDIEEFLLKRTATLVDVSLNNVKEHSDYISSAPEARDAEANAALLKAATGAIETLQKIHANKENNDARKELKEMDIKARKEINTADNTTRIALSQQEVMKMLMGEEEPVLTKEDKEQAIELD